MKDVWKHLYGVTGASQNFNSGPFGVGNHGSKVYTVPYKELSAIVSDTPFIDYKTLSKDLVIKYLLDHQRVVERVMESYSIIPFKFGSLAHNKEEVEKILARGYTLFKSLVPWVRERVEFELVARWDGEKVFKSLYKEESEIRSLQEMLGRKSETDALFEKIRLGKLVR